MATQAAPPPLIGPGHTFGSVTDKISSVVQGRRVPLAWFIGFGISFALLMLMLVTITHLVFTGIGIWGNNIPVGWGFDITNFVWWIGIGHAGTLISAILLLLRQQWRTSINRFAEAIVFGDINDASSRVAQLKKDPRNYSLLGDLNTRPRTTYLASIRNPNPELEREA